MTNVTIRADDLGMHPAIDGAILAAFALGAIHEAAWLAVGPSAVPAAEAARKLSLPISIHLAYASEWDRVRWGSLTGRLDRADGSLPPHPSFLANVPIGDLIDEGLAQIARARELGLRPIGFDFHIDAPIAGLGEAIAERSGLACRDIPLGNRPRPAWYADFLDLSSRPDAEKASTLLAYLAAERSDRRCVVTHPACGRAELETLCSAELGPRRAWAIDYRLSDYELLCDPDVRTKIGLLIERRACS